VPIAQPSHTYHGEEPLMRRAQYSPGAMTAKETCTFMRSSAVAVLPPDFSNLVDIAAMDA